MLNTSEMVRIRQLFAKADGDDFNEIANMFNEARRSFAHRQARSFVKGQKVEWVGKRGLMSGVITKVNRKNVVVDAGAQGMWNVTATMLKAA